MKTFSEKYQDICRHCQNVIYSNLNPIGHFVSQIQDSLEQMDLSKLCEFSVSFQQDWIAMTSEFIGELLNRFNQEVFQLCQNTIGKLGDTSQKFGELLVQDSIDFDMIPFRETKIKTDTIRTFDKIKNWFLGGMVGYAMANIAVATLTAICPPAGGMTLVATYLAVFVGAQQAHASMQQQQKQQILNQIQQQLQKLATQTQLHAKMFFEEKSVAVQREFMKLFDQSIIDAKKKLETQMEQASSAMKMSREENAKLAENLNLRLSKVEHLQKQLAYCISK